MLMWRLATLAGAMMLIGTGCGFLSRAPTPSPAYLLAEVSVEVENRNWSDITIYLMTGGLPQRLGMVTALSHASFGFPSQRLNTSGSVRLRALPVAGRPFTSETILVQPGQAIMWTLETDLDISSLSVY